MRSYLLGTLVSTMTFTACGASDAQADGQAVVVANLVAGENPVVDADLQFLREEEKLARDVYLTLGQSWNMRIFTNIASAEQRHMDRIGALLRGAAIPDTVTDDTVGAFNNEDLDALYGTLVERGSDSLESALRVGALIEDLDLNDIYVMMTHTDNEAVLAAYESLACGSRNHLRAFNRQLLRLGETYEPQHLDQVTFDMVIAAERERCGQRGQQGNNDGSQQQRRRRGGRR